MSITHFSGLGVKPTPFNDTTGHIAIPNDVGTAVLTKATAGIDYTLGAPLSGLDPGSNGDLITIFSTTAAAHVVTCGAGLINGATNGKLTFAAAIGNGVIMQAYAGVWYVISNIGVTVS